MSRHNVSVAQNLYRGNVAYPFYNGGTRGAEWHPMYRWRPTGLRAATATAAIAAGAVSCTLSANWAGASGLYPITFSDGSQLRALLTNGATTCPFFPPYDQPFLGSYNVQTGANAAATQGAVTSALIIGGQPPLLGVANALSTSASIAAGANAVLVAGTTGVPVIDVPRNVIGAWTTSSTVTVTGTDYWGAPQTEAQTGTAFTGKKAFATVTSIKSSAAITAATFGTGNVLGLPFRTSSGDIHGAMFNDATDAGTFTVPDLTQPATSATGDVRGTYVAAGTLNGAKFLSAVIKPADTSSVVGTFGVTPA